MQIEYEEILKINCFARLNLFIGPSRFSEIDFILIFLIKKRKKTLSGLELEKLIIFF
jgi:hypothetical protein